MNIMMNETQLWYSDFCDETINIKKKSKDKNSKHHKHEQKYGTVVKEYEFNKPDIDSVNYIFNDTIKECRKNYFLSFEFRCVYDIKLSKIRNSEEVLLSIRLG